MTSVLITGAGGFIARHLAQTLNSAALRVLGASHSVAALPDYDRIFPASLGETLLPALAAQPVDVMIHTALANGSDAYRLNVEGTSRWLDEGRAAGVSLQILLSTLSAEADALTEYGRAKWALEQRFAAAEEVAFRLGVVVGDGGMYARIRRSATRLPVTPLLDSGRQSLYVVGIDALCAVLREVIASNGVSLRGRAWNLVQPEPVTLRAMVAAIQRQAGKRSLLVAVPTKPMLVGLRVAESVPMIHLPVSSSNVAGLIQQGQRRVQSDWARFGQPAQPLETLVAGA
jgi:nucleoside-diphosphate-sugar epimerase